jgi:hypothetical protein
LHRIVRPFQVAQHVAEVEPHDRRLGEARRQPLKHRFGFGEFPLQREGGCHAELEMHFPRRDAARLAERLERIRVTPAREVRLGEICKEPGVVALLARRALEVRDRLGRASKLE